MADEVKAQAASKLGIRLSDQDVFNVPTILTDPYGHFKPGPARGHRGQVLWGQRGQRAAQRQLGVVVHAAMPSSRCDSSETRSRSSRVAARPVPPRITGTPCSGAGP